MFRSRGYARPEYGSVRWRTHRDGSDYHYRPTQPSVASTRGARLAVTRLAATERHTGDETTGERERYADRVADVRHHSRARGCEHAEIELAARDDALHNEPLAVKVGR